ncbi:hypothetical protein V8C44DRAFT_102801 [Trichoderma aethiopicum]
MGTPGYGSLIGLHSVHATRTLGLAQRHMPVEAFQERKSAQPSIKRCFGCCLRRLTLGGRFFYLFFCLGLNCVLSAALGVQTNGAPGTLIRLRLLAKLIVSKTISLRADRRTSSLEVVVRITMEQQLLKSNLEHLSFTLEIREGATGGRASGICGGRISPLQAASLKEIRRCHWIPPCRREGPKGLKGTFAEWRLCVGWAERVAHHAWTSLG